MSIVLLAVGGGVLYVYLTDGFKTKDVYPEIEITDSDNVLNNSQYEVTDDFDLVFTTQTEGVNKRGITLSFPSGVAFTRDEENGTISDGVITVPEKVSLDEKVTVSLVKQAYDKNNNLVEDVENYNEEENGKLTYINKGGISNLVITPESNTDYNQKITIAVDVPVLSLDLKFVDVTTGLEYENADGTTIIPEGTNFKAVPVFTPQESAYMFSDDKASNISEENKREKSVFYTLGTGVTGIQLNQSADGIYFTALEQVSQDNLVRAFAFASAKDELDFVDQNSSLEGEAFYNQAISVLSTSKNSIKGDANLSVIEANVGLFSILQNSADHPYELSVDKLFTILAGNNNPNGGVLSATIQDIHGADLSGMIRNIGMRVISATDSTGQNLISKVDLRGGDERTASNGNSYVLINSNVRDLNLAYFELSSSVECEIQLGIVLIVQDEEGNYNVFEEEKILYASVSTHEEDDVEWDIDWLEEEVEGINLKIIYNNGVPVPAQYAQNLYDVAVVPATNVYQRKVVFAYGDGVEGNVSYSQQGLGTYSYNGGNTKFYPLEGGELVVNHATSFNIVFATVQTNAYNEPIFNEDGTYKLIKTSLSVTVDVEDSLRGINGVEVEVTNGDVWLKGTQAPAYAIPSGSNITGDTIGETIKMTIYVESGDEQLFIDEFNNGNITFFASKDENGAGEKITNVFRFGTPVSNGAGTGSVSLNIGIEPNLKFSVEKGENYYLVVEYNNSISTESEVANIGGADRLDYITVYDQQTKTIVSGLENKNLTVTQTLQSNGDSSINIEGLEKAGVDLNALNKYFEEFKADNPNGIKTLDQYDREFKGNYSIASSNPTLVMANDISKTVSFGNGSGTATVTIKSGSATITLNFSVTSTGVSSIYVLEQQYTGTSSVSYSYTPTGVGDGSTEIKLKNKSSNDYSSSVDQGILTVYVNGTDVNDGEKYSNDAYTITLAPTFLSEVNSDLWNMISYKTSSTDVFSEKPAPTSETEIYSLRLNYHFGRSVTLIFNARNDNGTLNFTFSLTIQPTAQLTENSLNQVNYGEGITGVEKHTDTNTIGVYAGFGINLNNTSGTDTTIPNDVKNYLQVNNVEWGAVFEDNYYIYSDGSIKTKNENGYIAQINKGVLTFNDVTQQTSYNIKLYAVNTPDVDPLKGNYYGFSIDLSFVVYPNLQIEKSEITNGTISLLDMAQTETSGYSYTYIFELSRITTYKVSSPYNTSIGTNDLTDQLEADGLVGSYKFVDENNNNLEYIKVDMESNGNISRTTTSLHFDRNTSSKEIVLYCYDNSGNVIASNTFDLTLGIDVEKLKNSTTPLLLTADGGNAIERELNFDDKKMALITQSSINVSKNWKYNDYLTAELLSTANSDFYRVTSTEENTYTLSLQSKTQALRYDNNAYIRFNFKNARGFNYATWDIPVVLSQIGSDFPGEDSADLYGVINNGVNADALGGGAYNLLDLAGLTATSGDVTISFSYLKDGAVSTDYSDSLISSLTNGNIVFKNLSTKYSGLVDGKLPMDIQITMLKGDFSHTFILHLFVTPNATLNSVNYPYSGATTEYLSVESSLPVDLEKPLSNGTKRFPDIATPTVEENLTANLTSSDNNNFTGSILINEKAFVVEYTAETNLLTLSFGETVAKGENGKIIVEDKEYSYAFNDSTLTLSLLGLGEATYKIKAFYVDGVEASYDNLVSISGSELTLTNANNGLDNSTLIVEKSYSNFFGETLEYIFTINSTNVEYFLDIKKANDESTDTVDPGNGGWVINLGRGGGVHQFSITTKQRWENGEESSVLPDEVTTILQDLSVGDYTFALEGTKNPKTLTITVPAFVEADREINLTFVINDGQAEINVKVLIPATVDMQWTTNDTLRGGSAYDIAEDLLTNLNKDGTLGEGAFVKIKDVAFEDVNTESSGADYLSSNSENSQIIIQPIYKESKTAKIKVEYQYVKNITIDGKSYYVDYDSDSNDLKLYYVIISEDNIITVDGKTYSVSFVDNVVTLTSQDSINGSAGNIEIDGETYSYSYETSSDSGGTEGATVTSDTAGMLTIFKDSNVVGACDLSQENPSVTINGKTYNVVYSSESDTLTLSQIYTSIDGSILLDDKTYSVSIDNGLTKLTYTIPGDTESGRINVESKEYTYSYDAENKKLSFNNEGEEFYTYIQTAYTEKTFNFEPNISIKSQGIGDILARGTKTIALTQILESSDTNITSGGTYTRNTVNIDENLFASNGIDVVNSGSGSDTEYPYLQITPEYVGQNTPARIVFTLTYEKDGYLFTTDNIELTFTIVAAATYDVSYPNPFGAVGDLGYESYQKDVPIVFDERTISLDGKTYSVSFVDSVVTLTHNINGSAGNIEIDSAKYSYTYESSSGSEGTKGTTVAGDTAGTLNILNSSDEVVGTCDLSQENPSVTVNGKTYNVVYSSEDNTLTLTQTYTSENGSISLDGKTYNVVYSSGDNTLTLTQTYTSENNSISLDGKTYSVSFEDDVVTLTSLDSINGREGNIEIDSATYSYTYESSSGSEGTEGTTVAGDIAGTLTILKDSVVFGTCDLSQENPSVTINGKTYNVVYSSESNTLTLSQIYTSEGGSISLDDKTYSVSVVDSVVTLKSPNSINGSTYNFFGGKADFAEKNRITFSDVALTEGEITKTPKSYSEIANAINYSIISFSGFSNSAGIITNSEDIYDSTKWNSKIFEVAQGVTVAEGASVTFGITYKGVTAQYTIYFFTTVISASTNNTINYVTTASGSYENIYADNSEIYEDDTTTTNIFAKNRLAELSIVRDGAVAGSLQKIYVRALGAEDKDDYLDNPLASFVLTQSMIDKGSNIFVDIGILSDKTIAGSYISTTDLTTGNLADNLLDEGYEFVIGSFNSDGDFVGSTAVSFVRQASRVEYKYRLSNGNTQLINSAALIICESESTTSSGKFEEGEESTFIVTYKITESGTNKGRIEYKLKKVLDIEAQHAWSQSNQTVIEIETNKINHYTLVNEMAIRHPSTGEMLSAENIGEADISLQVVNTSDRSWDWSTIGGIPSNIPSNEFKYQTTSGDDYLRFTPIKDNDKVYDYYLFGEGADNNGTYVLLKLTYEVSSTIDTVSSTNKTFYFVVKLIPDYNVTIGGMQVATAGVVTDGAASNEDNPYNFVPDDKKEFNIATNNDSIISFVRSNWDSSNIAKSLTYTLTEQVSGNGYNEKTNTGKLQINIKGTKGWTSEVKTDSQSGEYSQTLYIYKWENTDGASNELNLVPSSIAFGQKLYMLEITNSWGFEIEFYFTLSSPTSQNPVISTAYSDATFTEGEKFDVGVIYDKIVANKNDMGTPENEKDDKYDLTMQRDILPEDNSGAVKMIVVDNIATWGINAEAQNVVYVNRDNNNINSGEDIYNNYMASTANMIYQYVTIESVGFKYLDENAVRGLNINNNKLITSSELTNPWELTDQEEGDVQISYEGIQASGEGRFTVPNLPGWYYGTNSSVQVEVHVTLKYQKNGDIETCDISFPATVSRQYNVSTSKNVVIDAQSFNLREYINVKNNGNDVTSGVTYYDDTLEVTLPAGGQATLSVEMTRGSEKFESSKTINNTYQYRSETTYNSLSEILGMTLQPNTDTVKINVTASEDILDSADFRVRYRNRDITEDVGKSTTIGGATQDKIFALKFVGAGSVQLTVRVKRVTEEEQIVFENSKTYSSNVADNIYVGTLSEFLGNSYSFTEGDTVEAFYWTEHINTTAELYYGEASGGTNDAKADSVVGITGNKQNAQRGYQINKLGSANGVWTSMGTDTLYIEDSGRFTNNYATVNKSYIVGVNNLYYRYNQVYWLTRKYYSLDTGLGDTTIRQIDADASGSGIQYYDEENEVWKNYIQSESETLPTTANFKIPISAWAKDVIIYQATQNNGQIDNGSESSLAGLFDSVFDITYTYTPANGDDPETCGFEQVKPIFEVKMFEENVGSFDMTYKDVKNNYEFATDSDNNLVSINGQAVEGIASGNTFSSTILEIEDEFNITYTYVPAEGETPATCTFTAIDSATFGNITFKDGAGSFDMTYGDVTTTYEFKADSNGNLISINGHTVDVASGEKFSSILLTSSTYFEVTAGEGDVSTAYFDGTYLYTGPDYTINNQQYILVNIYVKASGGPDRAFEKNAHGNDYRLGWFRVILV